MSYFVCLCLPFFFGGGGGGDVYCMCTHQAQFFGCGDLHTVFVFSCCVDLPRVISPISHQPRYPPPGKLPAFTTLNCAPRTRWSMVLPPNTLDQGALCSLCVCVCVCFGFVVGGEGWGAVNQCRYPACTQSPSPTPATTRYRTPDLWFCRTHPAAEAGALAFGPARDALMGARAAALEEAARRAAARRGPLQVNTCEKHAFMRILGALTARTCFYCLCCCCFLLWLHGAQCSIPCFPGLVRHTQCQLCVT